MHFTHRIMSATSVLTLQDLGFLGTFLSETLPILWPEHFSQYQTGKRRYFRCRFFSNPKHTFYTKFIEKCVEAPEAPGAFMRWRRRS